MAPHPLAPRAAMERASAPTREAADDPAPSRVAARRSHHAGSRAAPAPGAAESEHTDPGYLNLLATPTAEVFENGRRVGVTPLVRQPMTPGVHRLRLMPLDGRPARDVVITVRSGETAPAHVRWP